MFFNKESKSRRIEVMQANNSAIDIAAKKLYQKLEVFNVSSSDVMGRNLMAECQLTRIDQQRIDCLLRFKFNFSGNRPLALLYIEDNFGLCIAFLNPVLSHDIEQNTLSSGPFISVVKAWKKHGIASAMVQQKDFLYKLYLDKFVELFPDTIVCIGARDKTGPENYGWSSRAAKKLGFKKTGWRYYELMIGEDDTLKV